MTKKAVILVGGKGTRLYPYTAVFPKPLIPVGDKPILEILVRQLKYYGFTDLTFCVGHLGSLIEAFFKDGKWLDVHIDYSFEEKPLGTVGPLKLIKNLPEEFFALNGDLLTTANFKEVMRTHNKRQAALTIGTYKIETKVDLGVLRIRNGVIREYKEKPSQEFFISTGLYAFNKRVLDLVPDNEYFDIPQLVKLLIKRKEKVISHLIEGIWLDLGKPEDYQKAIELYSNNGSLFKK